MVLVALDVAIVEGDFRPSSDTPTHRRLLMAFAGLSALAHTRSLRAMAFAQITSVKVVEFGQVLTKAS